MLQMREWQRYFPFLRWLTRLMEVNISTMSVEWGFQHNREKI